jgi:hypothetical protein
LFAALPESGRGKARSAAAKNVQLYEANTNKKIEFRNSVDNGLRELCHGSGEKPVPYVGFFRFASQHGTNVIHELLQISRASSCKRV